MQLHAIATRGLWLGVRDGPLECTARDVAIATRGLWLGVHKAAVRAHAGIIHGCVDRSGPAVAARLLAGPAGATLLLVPPLRRARHACPRLEPVAAPGKEQKAAAQGGGDA